MAKIIVEIDDKLKKKFYLKVINENKTQREVLTKMVEDYVKEG